MDRTPPDVAAAMHDCFESVDVRPLLPGISAPVLLLSGDNSPIASAQQKALAETLPNGRVELFAGYGHGVNLAARLEGLALPGGICISADAWRHVRGAIVADFVDLSIHERLRRIH